MLKKILVAFDGSKQANHALNAALDLADKYTAEILLLTVVPPVLIPTYSSHAVTAKGLEECAKRLEIGFSEALSRAVEKVRKEKPDLKVSSTLKRGHPDEKIVETIEEGPFDLVVLGSRGLGRREFGGVSSRVADRANCPVLIVK